MTKDEVSDLQSLITRVEESAKALQNAQWIKQEALAGCVLAEDKEQQLLEKSFARLAAFRLEPEQPTDADIVRRPVYRA